MTMIGFAFAQTFFITAIIKYLELPQLDREVNHAYGLIGAAGLIYIGDGVRIAFKLSIYELISTSLGPDCIIMRSIV